MLKLKDGAIKTMADGLAKNDNPAVPPTTESPEVVNLNRKLREAFGISATPKTSPVAQTKIASGIVPAKSNTTNQQTPQPQKDAGSKGKEAKRGETIADEINSILIVSPKNDKKQENEQEEKRRAEEKRAQIEELENIKKQLEQKKLEEIKEAEKRKKEEEENKRQEAARLAEEQKIKEEEQKKREEEERIRAQKAETDLLRTQKERIEEEKRKRQEAARLAEEQKIKEEEQKKREEEERIRAQKAEEEKRRAEEENKRQEAARLAEEQKIKEEEQKKREEERRAAQEKVRREALRVQQEKEKAREEKRQLLAVFELEREKQAAARREQERLAKQNEVVAEKTKIETLSAGLEELILELGNKKSKLEKQLAAFPNLKAPLEKERSELESKASLIKNSELAAAEEREKEIERQAAIEKEKLGQRLSPQQEKIVEQKLWTIEDRRKDAEKLRWDIEDRIAKIIAQAKDADDKIKQKDEEALSVSQKIKTAEGQAKLAKFAIEKGKLEDEMIKVIEEREGYLPLLEKATDEKNIAAGMLKTIAEKEISTMAELNAIEQKEKQATDATQKRTAEQERWRVNENLKSTTQAKWESEEKFKEIETRTQSLQKKIDAINANIDGIQNKISSAEISLEKEGLRVGKIRDAISEIVKENNIEIDQELLKDITQSEDAVATDSPQNKPSNETKNTQKQTIPVPIKANGQPPQPALANAINGAQKAQPAATSADAKPAEPVAQKKQEPIKPVTPPAPINTSKTGVAEKNEPAQSQNNTNKPEEKIPSKPPLAAPAPAAAPDENKGEIAVPEPEKIKAETFTEESEDDIPDGSIWKPEARLSDITKNAVIAAEKNSASAAKPAAEVKPIDNGKSSAKTVSFYREQVESAAPSNIRPFPGDNTAKDATSKIPESTVSIKNIGKEPEIGNLGPRKMPGKMTMDNGLVAESNESGSDKLENRWNQIKKTTTPAANPIPVSTPETAQPSPAQLAPKTGKNKTLARILVVLALVIIIGTILAIVLTKNNTPVTVKKPTENTAPDKKKTITAEPGTSGDEKNNGDQSYLAVISTIPIYTEDLASVPNLLSPYLQSSLGSAGYYRVSILDKKNNAKVGLRQFFNIYKVNAPAVFYGSVSDDFTLYIYSGSKNRLGFVTAVTDEEALKTSMEGWEGSMQADTDNLFKLLGRKTQAPDKTLRFETSSSSGTEYSSMVFLPESDNFSLNWAVYGGKYLVFATSADALKKTFDQLPK